MESLLFLHAFCDSFERVGVLGPHAEYVEGGYASVIPEGDSQSVVVEAIIGNLYPETCPPIQYKMRKKASKLHKNTEGYVSTRQMEDEDDRPTFPLGGAAVRAGGFTFSFASDVGDIFLDEAIALYAAIRAGRLTWRMARKIATACEDPNVIFRGLNARNEPPPSRLILAT